MTKDQFFEMARKGCVMQYNFMNTCWQDIPHIIDFLMGHSEKDCFESGNYEFRIKPDFPYRMYESLDEFLEAQKQHGPWIMAGDEAELPVCATNGRVMLHIMEMRSSQQHVAVEYRPLLANYCWQDGTPCGVKLE